MQSSELGFDDGIDDVVVTGESECSGRGGEEGAGDCVGDGDVGSKMEMAGGDAAIEETLVAVAGGGSVGF